MTMELLERLCRTYDEMRGILSTKVDALEVEMDALKRAKLPGIKKALGRAAEAEATLRAAIAESPELFAKPRTVIFHGVKIGYQKGKGKLEWEDDAVLLAKIKKLMGSQVDQLINTKETPSKQGLNTLDVAELRRLGVTVEETGDVVVCKPVDSAVEKLVNALLKDAVDVELDQEVA
jgi:arsenate reductase-like glutaredoxin family protein